MKIGMIGAGNMAGALARGLGEPVLVTDAGSGRARALAAELQGEALDSNERLAREADVVILCHKPAQLQMVAAQAGAHARRVVSLLAATPLQRVQQAYPHASVVRAVPSITVALREGVTPMASDPDDASDFPAAARELFGRVGHVVVLPDRLLEAATGLSGVMPAYLALFAEAQIDSGIRHGVPEAQASEIVAAALEGSARLLRARDCETLRLRREVSSPGGVTARGLAALERGGMRTALASAMDAVLGTGA